MAAKGSRVAQVADALREAIITGVYAPGDRLPTETGLAAMHEVSRATVRQALRELETVALVRTQHGVGSFVVDRPAVRAGLERLDSITESIRATGREPGMEYKSRVIRPLLPEEAGKLGLPGDASALEVRRSILADGEVVAYSYDLIPLGVFPVDGDPDELDGSIFHYLRERLGRFPHRGVAEIHAVDSDHIGWEGHPGHPSLYLLLDQVHFDKDQNALMYSRTYFIDGRYTFSVIRNS
jgi:GntR family transcriptional regulator